MRFGDPASYDEQRQEMVELQLRRRGVHDARVLEAMLQVPRHEFIREEFRAQAYEDHPLPIAKEQTISQPLIIAISLLTRLTRQVYSVERHPELAETAERTLRDLGFSNVQVSIRDGSQGWKEHSPYDAILVSAAAPSVPRSLVEQLADEGRMVIPVGSPHTQHLLLVRRNGLTTTTETVDGCRFVPLVGAEGY
jgi:protein-L-isoaspartate(D-aspartate) O-methyltransferase